MKTYTGPKTCPVCDETMSSWQHLQEHIEELNGRTANPTDRAILSLKEHGCVVLRPTVWSMGTLQIMVPQGEG